MGFSARSYGAIIGANNRVNTAVIGIGGRGKGLIRDVLSLKGDNVSMVPYAMLMLQTLCLQEITGNLM